MNVRGLVTLFLLSLSSLMLAVPGSTVSAQQGGVNITPQCEWVRVRGQILEGIPQEAPQPIQPVVISGQREHQTQNLVETEYDQEVSLRCEIGVDPPQPTNNLRLVTQLVSPNWEAVLVVDQERWGPSFDQEWEIPLVTSVVTVTGLAPNHVAQIQQMGLTREIYPKNDFVTASFNANTGRPREFVNEFRATAAHPETIRVERRVSDLSLDASTLQQEIIDRAAKMLAEGFPEKASVILEDVDTVRRAEVRSIWQRFWFGGEAILVVVAIVIGVLVLVSKGKNPLPEGDEGEDPPAESSGW